MKIARMGHPVLREVAEPVDDPTTTDIRRLAADMVETMLDAGGVGLAAPQVHEGLRMLVYRLPRERTGDEEGPSPGPFVLVNPKLEPLDDEIVDGWEGCLSIPDIRGKVPRWDRLRFTGLDLEGEPVSGEATGFHARVLQHEVDHLDGVLYFDRMPDLKSLTFLEELRYQMETS